MENNSNLEKLNKVFNDILDVLIENNMSKIESDKFELETEEGIKDFKLIVELRKNE